MHWLFGALRPRTHKPVESPQIGHRLNTLLKRVRVVARTLELAGNLPRASGLTSPAVSFNTPAADPDVARTPVTGRALLLTGRQP